MSAAISELIDNIDFALELVQRGNSDRISII